MRNLMILAARETNTIDRSLRIALKGDAGTFFAKVGFPPMPPSPRILYVEDNSDTRDLVSLVLHQNDFEVVTVANPREAIQLAQSENFNLYILDNWMEGMSGIELCSRLREFDSATPILFFSGAGFEKDKQNALDCGAQSYLVKPASPEDLVAEARRLIAAKGQGAGH